MLPRLQKTTLLLVCAALITAAQPLNKITPPKIGANNIGDDYFLANYTQLLEYWNKIAKETDRMRLVEIGKTAEGRPMVMAIITSPANLKKLERYKEISQKLGRAQAANDGEARKLAAEGRAVVWIDGGLHATETVNAQALFLEAYDLVSRNDAETLRLLNDVILLLTPANPDGMELVSNWYMRESDPKKRNMQIPRLYQKYTGHDNNRDAYMANQLETQAMNRQLYHEWIPQIMYNQHQSGPVGTVLFFAPFRDPFNYNQDPLVPIGIDLVAAAVHQRFLAEGKPGAVMRSTAPYSTWFNGGMRTATGFHNQIGLLSEIIGNPTPMSIPLVPAKLLAGGDQPAPIGPRAEWHQRQSIEYVMTADRAILDVASRYREELLFRIYRAGKNSIERGNSDHWTMTPKRIAQLEALAAKERSDAADNPEALFRGVRTLPAKYWDQLRSPETRDPRGYIITAAQPDFASATKFVNVLIKGGVEVHRALRDFEVAGKKYPAGSYVVKAAQAFRPHLRDMFEPQDHPNDFEYPGGPPRPPYDVTGYTLAFQFGIEFDRILEPFDGPFTLLPGQVLPTAGTVTEGPAAGYLLSHQPNDAYTATTRLIKDGVEAYWLKEAFTAGGKTWPAGTIYIPAKTGMYAQLRSIAGELGIDFAATGTAPRGAAFKLRPVRVGLWDRYGGSMDSGHIRWLFEQAFPTPYELVYAPELDAGNLRAKFDVLILPDGSIPAAESGGRGGRGSYGAPLDAANVPEEYKKMVGSVTATKTIPQIRQFIEAGGTVLTLGGATALGTHLGLPIANPLVELAADGTPRRLGGDKYYIPGSILQVTVDNTLPIAYGLPQKLDVFFSNNPVFRLLPDAALKGTRPVAWFDTATPLRSGWAWGQHYLKGTVGILEANLGKGKLYLFSPEITFRGQPHGTFKFLFNGMQLAGAELVTLP